jgi:hypothetical protein
VGAKPVDENVVEAVLSLRIDDLAAAKPFARRP